MRGRGRRGTGLGRYRAGRGVVLMRGRRRRRAFGPRRLLAGRGCPLVLRRGRRTGRGETGLRRFAGRGLLAGRPHRRPVARIAARGRAAARRSGTALAVFRPARPRRRGGRVLGRTVRLRLLPRRIEPFAIHTNHARPPTPPTQSDRAAGRAAPGARGCPRPLARRQPSPARWHRGDGLAATPARRRSVVNCPVPAALDLVVARTARAIASPRPRLLARLRLRPPVVLCPTVRCPDSRGDLAPHFAPLVPFRRDVRHPVSWSIGRVEEPRGGAGLGRWPGWGAGCRAGSGGGGDA